MTFIAVDYYQWGNKQQLNNNAPPTPDHTSTLNIFLKILFNKEY